MSVVNLNQAREIQRLTAEVERLTELSDKFMWQVRDTYQRAFKAENPSFADAMRMARKALEAKPRKSYTVEDWEVLLTGLDILLKGEQAA